MSYRLTLQKGPVPGKIYELDKEVLVIGRDLKSDIPINDAEVSRSHAGLTAQGNDYLIEDLNSTNGTFVNGQRISGTHTLHPGDIVGLGETITLEYSATVSETAETVVISSAQIDATVVSAAPPPAPVQVDASLPPPLPLGGEPPKAGNRNMLIAVGIAAFLLICCCCPAVAGIIYYVVTYTNLLPW
jgi:predicted component of type VI protein secretion system